MKISGKILLIFFIIIKIQTFSQTGEVIYTVSSDLKRAKDSDKMDEEIALMRFTLVFNNSTSFFNKNKTIPIDEYRARLCEILLRYYTNYYQDKNKQESLYNMEIKGKTYQVDNSYKMKGWTLLEDTKVIDGYTCYKATRKEYNDRARIDVNITAWYTPEIPVPYGPIGNGGLPGLILQLHRHKRGIYTAKKIVLNSKVKVKTPKEGEKISVKKSVLLSRAARKVTPD